MKALIILLIMGFSVQTAQAQGAGSSGGTVDIRTYSCASDAFRSVKREGVESARAALSSNCQFWDEEVDCLIAIKSTGYMSEQNFQQCVSSPLL